MIKIRPLIIFTESGPGPGPGPGPLPVLATDSIRLRFASGDTPTFLKGTGTLVSAANNIWDLDLTGYDDLRNLFNGNTSLVEIVDHNLTMNVAYCTSILQGCTNVEGGFYKLYQYLNECRCGSTVGRHRYAFTDCGSNTVSGAAELAQIPSGWGGTGA